MLIDDEYRRRVDSMIRDHALSLDLAGAPRLPHGGYGPIASGAPRELALNQLEKGVVKGAMRASGADARFDRTLGRMTGGAFSPREMEALKERALTATDWNDLGPLRGIQEGPPVILNRTQKTIIDRIMGEIGADPLGDRARHAYGRSARDGQIQVR